MRRTVGILVACLAMALVLGGCGKHNLARNRECPKGWACYAPAQLPISEYCTHLLRRWEQVAERETQAGERVRPMLEGLIRQTMTMDAVATNQYRQIGGMNGRKSSKRPSASLPFVGSPWLG